MKACLVVLTGFRLTEVVSDPSPASLKDVVFNRLLSHSLPQFLVVDGVWPANLENPSEEGFDACLDFLLGGDGGSLGLGSIE